MKVSGMGPVARMLFRALVLTAAWGAETAFAGAWSCRVLTEANPLPASANLLRGRLPTDASCDGATAFAEASATRFTDGKITLAEDFWSVQLKSGGAYVCYSVTDDPAGVALASVRFTTTHKDKGRSQVRIAKLSVQKAGQDGWVELEHSSVIGPVPQEGETNFQAVYAEADGRPIAVGVTAIRLDFDETQQNDSIGVSEIEATALYPVAAWTRKTYATSAETCPLLPSADILHGKPPAVSADGMSVVCGLGDASALALGSVRVTSALEAGIRSLQVRTEATGETWFTLPASGLAGIGDGGVCQAVYANAEALPLVSGATGLKVVFAAALPDNWAEKIVVEATEAGIANWTCCPLAEPNPMPEAENALLGLEATAFACNGVGPSDVQTNLFTDGKIALKADGWRTRIENGGAFVSYSLSGGPPDGTACAFGTSASRRRMATGSAPRSGSTRCSSRRHRAATRGSPCRIQAASGQMSMSVCPTTRRRMRGGTAASSSPTRQTSSSRSAPCSKMAGSVSPKLNRRAGRTSGFASSSVRRGPP